LSSHPLPVLLLEDDDPQSMSSVLNVGGREFRLGADVVAGLSLRVDGDPQSSS
jgi:hypothetical protein